MQHYKKKTTTSPSAMHATLIPDFIQKAKFNWIGPKQVIIMEAMLYLTSKWQQSIYQCQPTIQNMAVAQSKFALTP